MCSALIKEYIVVRIETTFRSFGGGGGGGGEEVKERMRSQSSENSR